MHRQGPGWQETHLPRGHSENTPQKVVARITCRCWKAHLIPLLLSWRGSRQPRIPLRLGLVWCGAVLCGESSSKGKGSSGGATLPSPGERGCVGASLAWPGGECWLLWEQEFGFFCIQPWLFAFDVVLTSQLGLNFVSSFRCHFPEEEAPLQPPRGRS